MLYSIASSWRMLINNDAKTFPDWTCFVQNGKTLTFLPLAIARQSRLVFYYIYCYIKDAFSTLYHSFSDLIYKDVRWPLRSRNLLYSLKSEGQTRGLPIFGTLSSTFKQISGGFSQVPMGASEVNVSSFAKIIMPLCVKRLKLILVLHFNLLVRFIIEDFFINECAVWYFSGLASEASFHIKIQCMYISAIINFMLMKSKSFSPIKQTVWMALWSPVTEHLEQKHSGIIDTALGDKYDWALDSGKRRPHKSLITST